MPASSSPLPPLLPNPRSIELESALVDGAEPRFHDDRAVPPQGYRVVIGADGGVHVWASDAAGRFYAERTIDQLRARHDGRLPMGTIDDAPDLAVRGVMLDVSRDKVPTMATLEALVDRLASWKINHVQLYLEHTFAYEGHEEVWGAASPFTAEEIRSLDAYCAARHVELVPNQNCLGHMERWLAHDTYRPLALRPDGFDFLGTHRGPSTIDPAQPASLAFVRSLLAELLPNFTSPTVNVGLDEPWELPDERLGEFLDWVRALRAAPELDGRRMLMWGDVLGGQTPTGMATTGADLIGELPDGVTICDWGYEDTYPFADRAALLASAGRPFLLSPGTSSWLSILGRWTNAHDNIEHAVRAAIDHGGEGILVTDWGDQGHLQYLPFSELAFAYGAAVSWCHGTNADLDVAAAIDAHAFGDAAGALGDVLAELGDAHRFLPAQLPNLSMLVASLYLPALDLGRGPAKGLAAGDYEEARAVLSSCADRLDRATVGRDDGDLVLAEVRNAMALTEVCIDDAVARLAGDGSLASIPAPTRAALAARLDPIVDHHRSLWLARNRPGGLDDSVERILRLRRCYEQGTAAGLPLYG